MTKEQLKNRTKSFHIAIIKLCGLLPKNNVGFELTKQIVRSAGSVGANYRAALRAKSNADFIYKIEIIIEEADETMYWLEIIKDANLLQAELIEPILKEANELVSIFVATVKTVKNKAQK